MVFPVPGHGLWSGAARCPVGPVTGPSRGIGKAADDQRVWEMLPEQDTFLADILHEGTGGQQGRCLKPFQGHGTSAGHASAWGNPLGACSPRDLEDMAEDSGEPEGNGDDDDTPEVTPADHYELAMASECLTMDLPVQVTVFLYASAMLCMVQFQYDLLGKYTDHRCWEPLYMDTDSYYMSLGRDSLHECFRPEHKRAFYEHFHEWFPREACDVHSCLLQCYKYESPQLHGDWLQLGNGWEISPVQSVVQDRVVRWWHGGSL